MTGGEGRDRFRFDAPNEGGDLITDFLATDDQIRVKASGFKGGLIAGSAIRADQFTLGPGAVDASDRFIYDSNTGDLFFDRDGNGSKAQILVATLMGAPTISNTEIFVL